MTQGAVFAAGLMVGTSLIAGEVAWRPMAGAEITQVLTDRSAQYEGAKQHFYASGRTLYDSGRTSWGYWRVEGDQYCSQWPPGDLWSCYSMDRANHDMIRFVAADGSATEGQMLSE